MANYSLIPTYNESSKLENSMASLKIVQHLGLKATKAKWNGRWTKSPVLASSKALTSKLNAGFTTIELVIVVLVISVLAAIAAPGWLAFNNRQRLNKANDAVLGAIQDAQRQAKIKKLTYSVSFIVQNQVPQVAIYPVTGTGTTPPSWPGTLWKNLGDIGLQPGQVLIYSNIDSSNPNKVVSPSTLSVLNSSNPRTITFDYTGSLPNANFGSAPSGSTETPGLKVVVATGNLQNPMKRCVIVKTLIGGMKTAIDPDPSATVVNPCS